MCLDAQLRDGPSDAGRPGYVDLSHNSRVHAPPAQPVQHALKFRVPLPVATCEADDLSRRALEAVPPRGALEDHAVDGALCDVHRRDLERVTGACTRTEARREGDTRAFVR